MRWNWPAALRCLWWYGRGRTAKLEVAHVRRLKSRPNFLLRHMPPFLYRCPNTGLNLQVLLRQARQDRVVNLVLAECSLHTVRGPGSAANRRGPWWRTNSTPARMIIQAKQRVSGIALEWRLRIA